MAGPPAAAKTFNKLAIHLAGHRAIPIWAVLRHRGRKSGKEYSTPVAVLATDDTFVIGLPWGRGTDWVRNVRAAGGCTVRWKGREVVCTEPEFVGTDAAIAAAPSFVRPILQRREFAGGYLQLHHSN